MEKLQRYIISIDEGVNENGDKLGITQVAYVNTPAIMTKGVYLNDQKHTFKDELKGIVAAPALIPNLPIYRRDEELGEYEVVFTEDTILKLREDFMLNKGKVAFNLEHNENLDAPSFILDSWITTDPKTDPSYTKYGIELPAGSWFIVSKFTDMKYFTDVIVKEERFAYSIEGYLSLALDKNEFNNKNKTNMEDLKLPNGEHIIGEKVYVVEDGAVIAINDVPVEEPVEEEVVLEEVVETTEPITEEVTEEVVLEEEIVEEVVEEPVAEAVSEEAILKVVEPKLEELYRTIAELKNLIENKETEVEEEFTNVELSRVEKFNLMKSKYNK